MSKYKLVIFDWDGTVMDSAAKIIRCMQSAARVCELPIPTDDEVGHIIGISLRQAIQTLFALSDDVKIDEVVNAYKDAFVHQDKTPSPLFEGAEDVFIALKNKGITLAVATGKARRGLIRAWDQTNTAHYFTDSRCADDAASKPSPDMLLQLLEALNVSVEHAVMVGDTTYDMQMAQSIGMDRVAVSYGVHAQLHLEKHEPIAVIHDIKELPSVLLS